jgi:hypothetical protein
MYGTSSRALLKSFVGSFLKPGATVWRILYPLHEIVIHIFTKEHILFCFSCSRYTLVFLPRLACGTPKPHGHHPGWPPPSQWAWSPWSQQNIKNDSYKIYTCTIMINLIEMNALSMFNSQWLVSSSCVITKPLAVCYLCISYKVISFQEVYTGIENKLKKPEECISCNYYRFPTKNQYQIEHCFRPKSNNEHRKLN